MKKTKTLTALLFLTYQYFSFASGTQAEGDISMLELSLISLAGGFILNFMPCVLPVLTLKIYSLLNISDHNPKVARKTAFFVSLGVVTTFLIISFFVISLKLSGEYAGLGINFQNPYFITALVLAMMIFAAYMSGNMSIPMPQWLIEFFGSKSSQVGLAGSFFSGMLATILATPCTAPLLGSALSIAIAGEISNIVLVFFCLGIGMSLPFLIVVIKPNLIKYMPKPGAWSLRFKKFLEITIYLSVFWMLYILSSLLDRNAALLLFLLCLLFKFFLSNSNVNKIVKIIAIVILVGLAFFLPTKYDQNEETREKEIKKIWKNFSLDEIDKALADDKVVFVDISADWCLTCKYNKFTVLDNNYVMEYMRNKDVVTIRGDYTKENREINKFLSMHNHYAIPLNVIYSKKYPKGIKLDPILTVSMVISALNKAK